MNRKYFKAIIVLAVFVSLFLVSKEFIHETKSPSTEGKMIVTASFYPLAFLANEIGGDKVSVHNLTPAGAEPHEYEPSPRDMVEMERSQIILVNGLGLEPWIESAQKNLDPKKTLLLQVGEGRDISRKGDPHIWLSNTIMYSMAKQIETTFEKTDPSNKAEYSQNLEIFKERINALSDEYRFGLANCESRSFVTSHNAFGYLAVERNLKQIPIAGLSPDAEPSPKELGNIVSFAKENKVKYIFFESLVSPKLAQTIANEIGAKTLVLNPLEGLSDKDMAQGKNYFSVMRENLTNLQIALSCTK